MRKKALLTLVPTAGLLSVLWLSGSQSTALASSSTTEYRLTISPWLTVGGLVSIYPEDPEKISSINCSVSGSYCSITFSEPQNVTLEAEPSDGYTFAGWGGDCSHCGTSTTCTIYVNADKTCSATFTAIGGGSDSGGGSGGSDSGSGSGSGGSGGGSDSGSGGSGSGGSGGGGDSGGSGGSGGGSGTGGSGGTGGTGGGGGGGGCSMTGSASSIAGLWNILVWLSVPFFALARRIRKK